MEAIAHSPKFAAKAGVPQSVGKDFAQADKASGNFMKAQKGKQPPRMIRRGSKRGG